MAQETQTTEIGFTERQQAAIALIEEAIAVQVTNAAEHVAAGEKVNAIREMEKALEAWYKECPVIVEAKRIQGLKGELAAALEQARKKAKGRMMAWEDAEEEKRKAEERRLQAEAQKKADDEALAAAAEAEKAGAVQEAQAILETPVIAPTVVLPKTAPKVKGHSRKMVQKFRLKDPTGKGVKPNFMTPDLVRIGATVRANGKLAEEIVGGIEWYEEAA